MRRHTMTARRTHREPITAAIAMRELRLHAGSRFDPGVVAAALVCRRDAPIEIPTTDEADHA